MIKRSNKEPWDKNRNKNALDWGYTNEEKM